MPEDFTYNVKEAVYRLWELVTALSEDLEAVNTTGLLKMVGIERMPYVRTLIDNDILEKTPDDEYKAGERCYEAHFLILQDALKPPEESQIQKYLPRI